MVDHVVFAPEVLVRHRYGDKLAALQFLVDNALGQESHSHVVLHQLLDCLTVGNLVLHAHVDFVLLKEGIHNLADYRALLVHDYLFPFQVKDVEFVSVGELAVRACNQHNLVFQYLVDRDLRVLHRGRDKSDIFLEL